MISGALILEILVLSISMGVITFIGGILPVRLSISSNRIREFSQLSTGILVGTLLVLVIPEGVQTLISEEGISPININYIGFSLLLGYVTMYLIDNYAILTADIKLPFKIKSQPFSGRSNERIESVFHSTVTLGLIIHSVVDGIALGTSYLKEDLLLEFVFYLVIVLHKLPTAFSLTSILIKEGYNKKDIQFHLLLFSLSTPVSSILMYLFSILTGLNNQFMLGVFFLYSAGTFLYVVNHVMSELHNFHHGPELVSIPPLSADTSESTYSDNLVKRDILIYFLGLSLPTILALLGID
ncbi:ZIP zinc transporter-domain-containing protein [Scheffersomyces amazonensis]|uniref:ZIP zinc transporter-domain-containing protein n=1 Tax=Scheffersomyces amazonensis TaxID=1078765 RepID=UPI00315CD30A